MGPEDVELDDEVIQVDRPKRSGVVVSVRLSADEADELERKAQARGTTISRVAREAITRYRPPPHPGWTATLSGPGTLVVSADLPSSWTTGPVS